MQHQTFNKLDLVAPLHRAIQAKGYKIPTPIQAETIPSILKGKDVIGCAQTGTGKTAAFALPILHKLTVNRRKARPNMPRALILTPTRELAAQVGDSFKTYGRFLGLRYALVFGGVGQFPQVKALRRGVDVLVATPGRLLDLMRQGHLKLNGIEIFVLDEADRMLDMGFLPDIRKVIHALPKKKQAMLFSATMAPEIRRLAEGLLTDPVNVSVAPPATTADDVEEKVLFVNESNKRALLKDLLGRPEVSRALVFTKTKHGANRLAEQLGRHACAIHGNKSQTARMAALKDFKSGRCRVMVATDIASRGIDVSGITHVVNYDMPQEAENYVHRIGRTARAGNAGVALSFCGSGERLLLRDIERLLKRAVPIDSDHPYHSENIAKSCAGKKTVFSFRKSRSRQMRQNRRRPKR